MSRDVANPEWEAVDVLRSIDGTLKELLALSKQRRAPTAQPATAVADDAELDSPYGDELVKFKPKNWTGADFKGSRMSETSPEFLDMLADSFAYFARRNDENGEKDAQGLPKSKYDNQSARRARGWAARLRAGYKSKTVTATMAADEVQW